MSTVNLGDDNRTMTEPDPKRWSILAVVVIAQLMVVLDASIVTIALPSAQRPAHIGRQPAMGDHRLHARVRRILLWVVGCRLWWP